VVEHVVTLGAATRVVVRNASSGGGQAQVYAPGETVGLDWNDAGERLFDATDRPVPATDERRKKPRNKGDKPCMILRLCAAAHCSPPPQSSQHRRSSAAPHAPAGARSWSAPGPAITNLLKENVQDPILVPKGYDVIQDADQEPPRIAKIIAQKRLPRGKHRCRPACRRWQDISSGSLDCWSRWDETKVPI